MRLSISANTSAVLISSPRALYGVFSSKATAETVPEGRRISTSKASCRGSGVTVTSPFPSSQVAVLFDLGNGLAGSTWAMIWRINERDGFAAALLYVKRAKKSRHTCV